MSLFRVEVLHFAVNEYWVRASSPEEAQQIVKTYYNTPGIEDKRIEDADGTILDPVDPQLSGELEVEELKGE